MSMLYTTGMKFSAITTGGHYQTGGGLQGKLTQSIAYSRSDRRSDRICHS